MFTLKNDLSPCKILADAFTLSKTCFSKTFPFAFLGVLFGSLPRLLNITQPYLEGVCAVIGLLVSFYFTTTMIFRLYCTAYQIPHQTWHALKHALQKFFPLILLTLLYALIVLSGTMLLIVPGIILAISLMFSFILLIIDNQNILQSLMMSHRLIWGRWWYTVFMMSFPFLINIILFLATLLAINLLSQHFYFSELYNTLSFFFILLMQAFILPFVFSVALLLIYHLKQKANVYVK
jgi:hypothetical protein